MLDTKLLYVAKPNEQYYAHLNLNPSLFNSFKPRKVQSILGYSFDFNLDQREEKSTVTSQLKYSGDY